MGDNQRSFHKLRHSVWGNHRKQAQALALGLIVLAFGSGCAEIKRIEAAELKDKPDEKIAKPMGVEPFANWPKAKPEVVIVLSGQMYSHLQKCGCSNPQKGGLERRYNLMEWLKAEKGWDVLALDLGDVAKLSKLQKQSILKYQVAMESLEIMGYRAIALGHEEFRLPLIEALSTFSLQNDKAFPKVHGSNLANRDRDFPSASGKGSMVLTSDTWESKSKLGIGITGLLGRSVIPDIQKVDSTIDFSADNQKVIVDSLAEMEKSLNRKPELHVMLYQGKTDDAQQIPKFFPQFQVIVCRSEESEPPAVPLVQGDSIILRVGHKGQNVGILGVFKEGQKLSFHYEKMAITEDFETPDGKEKDHPILRKLEWYAKEVKDRKFLEQYPKVPHPMQSEFKDAKVSYAGSESCKGCHAPAFVVWQGAKHSKAYEALEKIAKKPGLRNFDGECIVCHTVGFDYKTGFDGSAATMHLKDVGCENCHGPASMHVANPLKKDYYKYLSPWKVAATDRLPSNKKLDKLLTATTIEDKAKIVGKDEEQVMLRVDAICQKCHDPDNDPHFRFEKYWPQIAHPSPK